MIGIGCTTGAASNICVDAALGVDIERFSSISCDTNVATLDGLWVGIGRTVSDSIWVAVSVDIGSADVALCEAGYV